MTTKKNSTTNPTAPKERFRVRAHNYGPNLENFAKKLQDSMNRLTSDGYQIQLQTAGEQGVVIIATQEAPSEPSRPRAVLLDLARFTQSIRGDLDNLPKESRVVYESLIKSVSQGMSFEDMGKAIKERAKQLTAPATTLLTAASDLEKVLAAHACDDADCPFATVIQMCISELKAYAQLSLQ